MKTAHMTLAGKGGIGKSTISAYLAQKLAEQSSVLCLNTDPLNPTICYYDKLESLDIEIMDGRNIDKRNFDGLIEAIIEAEQQDLVIDFGSSSFIVAIAYMLQNDVIDVLAENGVRVVLHTVVTGGQQMADTVAGLDKICEDFGATGTPIVVWLNEFWGPIANKDREFSKMGVYEKHQALITAIVRLEQLDAELFAKDIAEMLKNSRTLDEEIETAPLMVKQRLKKFKQTTFNEIEQALAAI